MNVRIEPIADQHGYLWIEFQPADYLPKVKEELKRLKKTAHIKGFRQGAAPDAMLQKLYGDEVKGEILNKMLNQVVTDYQKDHELQFLGDLIPVPAETTPADPDQLDFKFEVGIAPKPDLDKVLGQIQIKRYKVQIPEDRIDEEVEHLRNRVGESMEIDEPILREDFIELEAVELEGGVVKPDGWKTQFPVSLGEHSHETFLEKVIGLKKQDRFIFNIHEVEKSLSEKEIRKYLLKLPEDHPEGSFPGDEFEASITKVLRKKPAELSEDFYKKAFGPDTSITNESELRQNLRENLQRYFDQECSKLLDLELVRKIVHDSGMRFPDAFLTKWLQASYTEWADKAGHELEHELLHFKEGLAWKLLREHIVETRQLNLKYEELTHAVIEEMKTQYPGIQLPDESWQELARRTLQDKEKSMHYFIEAQNRKALEWVRSQIQIEEAEVSLDEFREKVKHINAHNH